MVRAVSLHSVVPLRADAKETAEQLTQILFVETCEVLETTDKWLRVRLDADGQTGWADRKMLSPLSDDEYRILCGGGNVLVRLPMTYALSEGNSQTFPLAAGTRLPYYHDGTFNVLGAAFRIDPQAVLTEPLEMNVENLQQAVRFFLNTPYQWGGKNALGMDCSGFVQVVMSLFGHRLPRNASEQAATGTRVNTLRSARTGDLVFFNHADLSPEQTRISHVGILLDNKHVVHCSGRVKVETITSKGLPTHHLAAIRRPEELG